MSRKLRNAHHGNTKAPDFIPRPRTVRDAIPTDVREALFSLVQSKRKKST